MCILSNFLITTFKCTQNFICIMENKENTYPEGHFLGIWMGIGIAISFVIVFLCIVTDNPGFIGIGPAIGVSFGLAIGSAIENKYKKEGKIRPLTESEIKRVTAGIIILALGALIGLLLYFLQN